VLIKPPKVPRFALPCMGDSNADPFLRHNAPSQLTIADSAKMWSEVRERLSADIDADLDDLLIGDAK
jgi:hypothetical protein